MKKILLIAIVMSQSLLAAKMEFNGFVDTYNTANLKNNHAYNSSRNRFRGELYSYSGNASYFVSFDAIENNVTGKTTELSLREAYVEYIGQNWDVRLGRQIIVWGKADGLRITDILCPSDYSEFIARDFNDIRIPVESIKFRYLPGVADFELVWLPFFEPTVMPAENSPWAMTMALPEKSILMPADLPEDNLKNSEFAGKVSMFMSGIDFALSYFHTWDDLSVMNKKSSGDSVEITPEYHRLDFVGIEMNKPLGDWVVRSEIAFYKDKYLESNEKAQPKNLTKMMIGLDWYPGNDWTVSAQLANDLILDYENTLVNDENQGTGTLNISKKLMRQTLTVSNMIYFGINESDIYDRLSADYALNDNLHIIGGIDIFSGDQGMFGQYEDNSQIFFKAKYSF